MRETIDMKSFLIIFLFVFSLLSPLFLAKKTSASKSDLPIIQKINQVILDSAFDSRYIAIDREHKRLFLSSNGIKIFNISDPYNIHLLGSSFSTADYCLSYHDNYLYVIKQSDYEQIIKIYNTTNDNIISYVSQTEPFDFGSTEEAAVNKMYFPNDNLLVTCGNEIIRFWDISDKSNVTCLSFIECNEFFFSGSISSDITIVGLDFHPTNNKFLVALNYYTSWGGIFLVDFSDPSNPINIEFPLGSFEIHGSSIKSSTKNSIVSNGIHPCFITGSNFLEVINWENASEPSFGAIFELNFADANKVAKFSNFVENKIISYNYLSGLIDISNLSNIHFLTAIDSDTLYDREYNIYTFKEPMILEGYIFAITEGPVNNQGFFYQLNVYTTISPSNNPHNSSKLWLLSLLVLLPIIGIIFLNYRKIK